MQEEIIISGFGGQGTLFAGQLLAYAAMDSGYHVTWIPSYGPEMRGGKARCTVIVSDEEIGSPLVRRPSAAIVLNIPSMEAFEPAIKPGGVLVVNSSLVPQKSERDDIRVSTSRQRHGHRAGQRPPGQCHLPGRAGAGHGGRDAGGGRAGAERSPARAAPQVAGIEL